MSKIDAMRAMREAKYAARQAPPGRDGEPAPSPGGRRAAIRPVTGPATVSPAPASPAEEPPATAASATEAPATEARCGHRSMNGRTCTREAGHAAKSHRYG